MILKQLSFSNTLGDNKVTVTIIGDTGKLMENFRITKVTVLHDVCR